MRKRRSDKLAKTFPLHHSSCCYSMVDELSDRVQYTPLLGTRRSRCLGSETIEICSVVCPGLRGLPGKTSIVVPCMSLCTRPRWLGIFQFLPHSSLLSRMPLNRNHEINLRSSSSRPCRLPLTQDYNITVAEVPINNVKKSSFVVEWHAHAKRSQRGPPLIGGITASQDDGQPAAVWWHNEGQPA